jgi:alginate O-acetyltransferase complex protein AlgI
MVFSSIDFLFLFLPCFLFAYSVFPAKNFITAIFSIFFYFVGEGWYTTIVLFSVIMNFVLGHAIELQTGQWRKRYIGLAIFGNLSLLVFFKYAGFISENLFRIGADNALRHIHLPLGISFFTFHAMSYLIDIYRHDAKVERSLPNLAVYILMFPQLIAGPILRYAKIAPQLTMRSVSSLHIFYGLFFFFVGLGSKVLIADTLAGVADPLFAQWKHLSFEAAWIGAIAYTFQIYFDFSGYSAMAIGLGLILGFDYPENFNFPYMSQSITEFWRRWHMTLSSWFRDYLYIPLGGNRYGEATTYRNLFIVFVLCGLWHGAAWTFVIWGLYHGLILVLERMGLAGYLRRWPAVLRHVYAILAIIVGWVLFRSESLEQASGLLKTMFWPGVTEDIPFAQIVTGEGLVTFAAAAVFSTPLVFNGLRRWIAVPVQRPWPTEIAYIGYALGTMLGLMIFAASLLKIFSGSYSPFIYFRF